MGKSPKEWLKQADYDIKTAEIMFDNKRHFYAVFMSHLSIEKALKGLYTQKLNKTPPKTHNLIFLVDKIKLELSEDLYEFIFTLNGVSVPTRYPDELQKLQKDFTQSIVKDILLRSKEALEWIKTQF